MAIENRNLKVGTKLVGRYHKQSYSCEVVEGDGGKLRYRLEDGREFKSPSAAGMAITGHACDGWVFWSVQTIEAAPAAEVAQNLHTSDPKVAVGGEQEQNEVVVATPASAESGTIEKGFFRTPNQKGVPEGQTRWYCQECGKSFLAATGQTPQACPQGHQAS